MSKSHATSAHLIAFTSMLARDRDASQLNLRDLQIIALLVSKAEPLSVSAIATLISISNPQVSRITKKLTLRHLLKRNHEGDDWRLALYEPTAEARALDARVRGHFDATAA